MVPREVVPLREVVVPLREVVVVVHVEQAKGDTLFLLRPKLQLEDGTK